MKGGKLVGTIYSPNHPQSAVVIVHDSDQVPRMTKLAERLAKNNAIYLYEIFTWKSYNI
jgi:hypothetical protein